MSECANNAFFWSGKDTYSNLIRLRDTFSDTNDETNLIFDSLDNGICCERRGDIEDCRIGLSLPDGLVRFTFDQEIRNSNST